MGLLSKYYGEIWDFFEYQAHDNWEYKNVREDLNYPIPTLCAHFLCDYCKYSGHSTDACAFLTLFFNSFMFTLSMTNRTLVTESLTWFRFLLTTLCRLT